MNGRARGGGCCTAQQWHTIGIIIIIIIIGSLPCYITLCEPLKERRERERGKRELNTAGRVGGRSRDRRRSIKAACFILAVWSLFADSVDERTHPRALPSVFFFFS